MTQCLTGAHLSTTTHSSHNLSTTVYITERDTSVSTPPFFSAPLPISSLFHLLQSASILNSSLPFLHLLSSPIPGDSVHTYADEPHISFPNMNPLPVPEDISSFVPAIALQTFRSHKFNIAFTDLSFFLLYSSSHRPEVLNMAQIQNTMVFRLTCYPAFQRSSTWVLLYLQNNFLILSN